MTPLLEVNGISKRFGGVQAVKDVSFRVRKGQVKAVIGPNGAGKTTLFRCITGVYQATSGRILFNEKDITRLMPHQICVMGVTNTHQVVKPFMDMTVLDNVRVGAFFGRGWMSKEVKDATKEAMRVLEFTGLAPRADPTRSGRRAPLQGWRHGGCKSQEPTPPGQLRQRTSEPTHA